MKNIPYKKKISNISKFHFNEWRFQSEGASEDIYLVTKDNFVVKIPADRYGQKQRRMKDGHLIDRYNMWFGPRKLIHDSSESAEVISNMKKIKNFFDIFAKNDENQFKLLGNWWSKLSEKDQCEILEVLTDCSDIRNTLAGGVKGKEVDIKKGLKLFPERLVTLSRKKNFKAPKVSDIIGSRSFIDLPELGEVGLLAGGIVDEWMEDYISEKYKQKEEFGEVNLFSLLEKIIRGEHSYKKCSLEEKTKFYNECKDDIFLFPPEDMKLHLGEKLQTPKVVGVVKGGTMEKTDEIRVSVGTVTNKSRWYKKWVDEAKQDSPEQAEEYIKAFVEKGRKDGIIDVKCKRFNQEFSKSLLWFFDYGKQKGCEYAWIKIFSGDVHDKRLCLFEIPNSKSYVREYKWNFLNFSIWWNNNKFWAKCSTYAL